MTQVDAIYQHGVFRPLQDVGLRENQQVRLSVQLVEAADARAWLTEVQELHQRIITERGYLPDSTPGIAEDRRR